MGDRRTSFPFRFWTSAAPRRTPTTQSAPLPPAPPATTSTPTPSPTTETKAGSQSTTSPTPTPAASSTSLPPSETENQKPDPSTTTTTSPTPTPTTEPTSETQMSDQPTTPAPSPTNPPSSEGQTATQPTNTATIARSTAELQISSPSRAITQPRASLQPAAPARRKTQSRSPPQPSSPSLAAPASPSRRTTQSKSPPQPLSPSQAALQTRSTPSSPSRSGSQTPSTPQRTLQPRSPPHLVSRSPRQASSPSTKDTQFASPSKRSTQEISSSIGTPTFIPKEEGPKLAASQQEPIEPQPNKEVKYDHTNDSNGLITNEETREVKEVVQVTNTEANEETKEEVNGFLTPKSGTEAQTTENASISDQMHVEKQETFGKKENLAASSPNIKPAHTSSQPRKRDMTFDNDKQSALPSGEHVPLYKEIREDISTFVNRIAIGDPKSAIHEKSVSVITLAGENRGASMHLGLDSSTKEGSIHIHRGYKINPDESANTNSNGEGSSKEAAQTESAKTLEDQPPEAYVNNNAQSINNSLVFNCSITERNPGVHMVFTHVPKEPIGSTDKTRALETRKAEFNTTLSEKLTYEPTIRRRCLKGLFLEPSDSETENPEKPRRHGCRVGCKERGKHDEIDVLSA